MLTNKDASVDHKTLDMNMIEVELPIVLLKLGISLSAAESTSLKQSELPFQTTVLKKISTVKFIFQGDVSSTVELLPDRLKCTVAYCGSAKNAEDIEMDCKVHNEPGTNLSEKDYGSVHTKLEVAETSDVYDIVDMEVEEQSTKILAGTKVELNEKLELSQAVSSHVNEEISYAVSLSEKRTRLKRKQPGLRNSAKSDKNVDCVENLDINSEKIKQPFSLDDKEQTGIGTGDEKYICPGCTKNVESPTKLLTHVKVFHKTDSNYSELMKAIEDLIYHNSKCTQSLVVLSCTVCHRERRGAALFKHIKIWHSEHDKIQLLLEEAKTQYKKTKRVMKTKRDKVLFNQHVNSCLHCHKVFSNKTSFQKHVDFACEFNPDRRHKFNCTTCGYSSPNEMTFQRHQQQHGAETRFICDLCGKGYKNRSGLVAHQRDVHQLVKKIPIIRHACHLCEQTFYQKTHFARHVSKHADDRPMQCDLCGKRFKQNDHLNRHRREVHQNLYPYRCDKCGHGMSKLSYLKVHKCERTRRSKPDDLPITGTEIKPDVIITRECIKDNS